MRRVGSKLASDKMSQGTEHARGFRSLVTGCVEKAWSADRRHLARQPVSTCLCGLSISRFGEHIAQARPGTGTGQSASTKRRPESGDTKGAVGVGATMGRKGAGNYRIRKNAAVGVLRTITFCLRLAGFLYSIHATGCTHKLQATVLYRCRATRSAPACGPGDRGGWSARAGSGQCRR